MVNKKHLVMVPGRAYAPGSDSAKRYKESVRLAALAKIRRPLQGSLFIKVHYYYSDSKHRVDGDNLLKIVCDALKGVAYGDDSQIDSHQVERVNTSSSTVITDIPTPSLWDYIEQQAFVIIEVGELSEVQRYTT